MVDDRTVACLEGGEHNALLVLGALGCVMVPLPVVSTAVWITLRCPVLMVGEYSSTS